MGTSLTVFLSFGDSSWLKFLYKINCKPMIFVPLSVLLSFCRSIFNIVFGKVSCSEGHQTPMFYIFLYASRISVSISEKGKWIIFVHAEIIL